MAKGKRGGKRAEAGMPELKGSEKQVSWAKDIRETALRNLDNLVKNAKKNEKLGLLKSAPRAPTPKQALTFRKQMKEVLKKIDSAATLIDKRDKLSYNAMERMAHSIK